VQVLPKVMRGLDPRIQGFRMPYWVYILASRRNGTLYVGVTNDLVRRVWEHKQGFTGFTAKYGVKRLVYFEDTDNATAAIQREKNLKHWPRAWKIALVERANPNWCDLYDQLTG
jgi:putative endonuclease